MTAFKGPIWKIGKKDRKVCVQIWNHEGTVRLTHAELSPDQAYNIGQSLIDMAIEQGE